MNMGEFMTGKLGPALVLAFAAAGCAGVPQNEDSRHTVQGLNGQSTAPQGMSKVTLRPPFDTTLLIGARLPFGSRNPAEGTGFKASFFHGYDGKGQGWTCPGILDPVSGRPMSVPDFEDTVGPDRARRMETLEGVGCEPDADQKGAVMPGQHGYVPERRVPQHISLHL